MLLKKKNTENDDYHILVSFCLATCIFILELNRALSAAAVFISLQSGVLPAAHWRPRLHRGGLCGQRRADRLLCPHWQKLCDSKWPESTKTFKEVPVNDGKFASGGKVSSGD